jgi:eukaryotic-like serine/threonine-protein kinase
VTYQMLCGRLPYDAASLTELAMLQQRAQPPRLDEVTGDVPAALAVAVERALALDPDDRYDSADEMRKTLHDGARGIFPDATAATSMLPGRVRDATAATRPVTPHSRRIQPQPPQTPPPPPPPDLPYEPRSDRLREQPPRRNGALRGLAVFLVAGILAAVIAYAVGTSQGGSAVTVRQIDGNGTGEIVDQMESLIDDNTR